MRKRNHQINVRLDENELKKLEKKVAKSGITREAYIRKVLNGSKVYPTPPVEFYDLIREVRRIGNNINQLTRMSNAGEKLDVMLLNNALAELDKVEDVMWQAFGLGGR